MHDQDQLNDAYNARASVPDYDAAILPYFERSAAARAALDTRLDVEFGPTADERLDIFPAPVAGAPIHLFIHGGYWRALSKDESSFAAPNFVANGANFVCNSYALAPDVTLDEIVRQNRAALAWLYHNAASFGGDPQRIYLSGHSAGGHLLGMLLNTDWAHDFALPADVIKGAVMISGLFDLRPLRHSFINEWLQLDESAAHRNSPILSTPDEICPLTVAWAEHDPAGFHEQSEAYLRALRSAGHDAGEILVADHTHFSLPFDMAEPDSALARTMFEQMSL